MVMPIWDTWVCVSRGSEKGKGWLNGRIEIENRSANPQESVTDGMLRAPHRAFLRAMGHDDAAIAQPFAGVVSTGGLVTLTLGCRSRPEVAAG